MRELMKAMVAWAAGYYSQRLSENVRAGLARKRLKAEEKGEEYTHGRRAVAPALVTRIQELQAQGLSVRKISKELVLPVYTST
ncbi:hypothetical protein F1C16_20415 (plasmid) [Hymenobacter sp. NBH84]|uniref:hypothetical protein n=1 Tax=Hymenobacter sp. NBH84 TaxID=2596915 RepID=UPI0016267952|nr:hypothetical protein [Hymenobacter sp. NBH84]QNE41992.1 hypothetical protein F1C16_20415 [Hymenobacter sp. NBH84]